jgi:3-isopropylmalate/(R)-2-methylmalate dehydratase small subunit
LNAHFTGVVAPLDRADVDTDVILPKQFLRSIENVGFGEFLFDSWRYLEPGELGKPTNGRRLNNDFVLNMPRYRNAEILVCRRNFGSGSSREHAAWALRDFGFRALIAPSFGDIFYMNSLKNGLVAIVLPESVIDRIFSSVAATPGYQLEVDLSQQTVRTPDGDTFKFAMDAFRKRCLIEGVDEISYALSHSRAIRDFEARRQLEAPWLFGVFER